MNLLNIQSGWWVIADNRFVRPYDTKEEAIKHVKYQKEEMKSTAKWHIQELKITFGECINL